MDSSRFDSWTRRRVVLGAGGLAGLLVAGPAQAHKRRKKRCLKLGAPCKHGGRPCCHHRTCGGLPERRFCCKQAGESCGGNGDCCNQQCVLGFCANN